MAAHSSILAWSIPWTEELVHEATESDTTEPVSMVQLYHIKEDVPKLFSLEGRVEWCCVE